MRTASEEAGSGKGWHEAPVLVAAACFALFVALLYFLPLFSALDAAAARLLLTSRSCSVQGFLDWASHLGYALAALLVIGVALSSALRSRSRLLGRNLWTVLATVGTGALLVQFLKTFIIRERPSMIPGMAIGHSMPSGDITNGAIALGVAVWLTGQHHPRLVRNMVALGSVPLLLLLIFLRLFPLRHWLTDAAASLLLALACLCFLLVRLPHGRWWAPVAWAGVLAAALLAVAYAPALRMRLASALVPSGSPVDVWQAAAAEQASRLEGKWFPVSFEGRLPSVSLRQGEGAILVTLPRPGRYRLQFGILPVAADTAFTCAELAVTVNHEMVASFVASGGWRQYEVEIPAKLTRVGANRIGLALAPDRGVTELRLSYLALYPS